jgi:hypothetical protein
MYIVSLSSSVQKRVVRKSQSSVNSASRKRNFLVHRQRGVNYASRRQDSDKCWSASRTSRFHKRFKLNFVSTSVLVPPPPSSRRLSVCGISHLCTSRLCRLLHVSSPAHLVSAAGLVSRVTRLCCKFCLSRVSSPLQVSSPTRLVSGANLISHRSRSCCRSRLPHISSLAILCLPISWTSSPPHASSTPHLPRCCRLPHAFPSIARHLMCI